SGFIWNKRVGKIRAMDNPGEKVQTYQAASLTRYALMEAPGLLGVIGYFLTGNIKFLVIVAGVLLAFILVFPSSRRVARDIQEDAESLVQL
ncbi:MAG TPA: hypothetical protein VF145_02800, partial [Chitinophagaceae bacterium]